MGDFITDIVFMVLVLTSVISIATAVLVIKGTAVE